jgi:hypothetical protein
MAAKQAKRGSARKAVTSSKMRSHQGELRRLQLAIDILQRCHIVQGWHESFDQDRAARVLKYTVDVAGGKPSSPARDQEVIAFCGEHGISLEYIYRGDIGSLIASGAAHSPAAKKLGPQAEAKTVGDSLFGLENTVCEARHLGVAIRAMSSSDELNSDVGSALSIVSDQLVMRIDTVQATREWLCSVLNGSPEVPDGFQRLEHSGKVWLRALD